MIPPLQQVSSAKRFNALCNDGILLKRVSRQARELSLVIIDDVAVDCNGVGNVDNDEDGGGGSHFVEISKFWTGFAAGNDFLEPYRVESIDKGLVFDLVLVCIIDRAQ